MGTTQLPLPNRATHPCSPSSTSFSRRESWTSTAKYCAPHDVCYLHALLQTSRNLAVAIPDPRARAETVAWFRSEIERGRHITDIVSDLAMHFAQLAQMRQHTIESKITVTLREVRRLLRVP